MKVSLVLFIFGLAFAVPAWGKVEFRDLNPKDEEVLKKHFPKLRDADVGLPVLDDALRELISKGTYENVFIERKVDGNYEMIGKPLRVIEEIKFNGTHAIQESDLRELLELKLGDRFDRKKAVASGEKMKNYYGEHGFFNTIIELNFQKMENQNIRLVFDIQEKRPVVINDLQFETPNTDLKALLVSHFKGLRKKLLTTERVHKLMGDIENLLIDHRYLASEVVGPDTKYNEDKTEVFLKIEVRDPWRFEFYFTGNTALSNADVYHALDLKNHDRKNVDPTVESAERLRRAYIEKGYANINIETKVLNPPGTYLKRTYFAIHEGPRVKIKAIEIQGRASRPSKFYQDFILKNSSDLVAAGFFVRADLDNGSKNLVTELRNEGFLRARVMSTRVEFSEKGEWATLYVLLEEGPQTQIRSVEFSGNKFFSSYELTQVTGMETNTPLKLTDFEQSLDKLKAFYHNQGFLEMKLLNSTDDIIHYNEKGTQARIAFQIFEGPRIRIHSILVEGNVQTKTSVILTETDFKLGEVLTPAKIDNATARLNRLGLFSHADIRTSDEGTSVADRTLIISVSERDPGQFDIGIGATNERNITVHGFTGASYNNLWGTARGISTRGEINYNISQVKYPENLVTVGYLEPFLFNTRTRGRVNLTRSQYVFNYFENLPPGGPNFTEILVKNRVDFSTERDLNEHLKFTYKVWSLETRDDYERFGRCLPATPGVNTNNALIGTGLCGDSVMQVATTGPQLDLNYRDNPFLPTRGYYMRWSLDYADPRLGSTTGVQFIRTEYEARHYLSLGRPGWVWANSFRVGYLSNLSPLANSGVPTDYDFILGGITTVRGFDNTSPNERIPKDGTGADPNVAGSAWLLGTANQQLIRSDSNYQLIKTEVRFPIVGDFGGVLFYDGGAVRVSGYHFGRPYRDAAGFGFRYNTPVGPAAFDFAFKINPEGPTAGQSAEAPFRFQFSIGTF